MDNKILSMIGMLFVFGGSFLVVVLLGIETYNVLALTSILRSISVPLAIIGLILVLTGLTFISLSSKRILGEVTKI